MKTNDGLSDFAIRSARHRSLRVKQPEKIDCAKVVRKRKKKPRDFIPLDETICLSELIGKILADE